MINETRIKQQVKKAISIKPIHIKLMRNEKISNGMRGGSEKPALVKELDVFLDDSKHNLISETTKEAGSFKRTKGISMLAVVDDIEIKEGDYFEVKGSKYRVTYPGMIIRDVYNADLEVIK
ncbi:hypothetical protein KPL40_03935 [Clostridium gasigenes]|uniref:hypothetical protein n=1 Tax=Clostridium gasigenes TaxID=94869 RepID=UPI001C0D26C8|nr:hypothetical protein [Clostridium gasigenes]MBU3131592.1 hypothetical protein [Clostridium gasigenes]